MTSPVPAEGLEVGNLGPYSRRSSQDGKLHCDSRKKAAIFPGMSITAKIQNGSVILPSDLKIPDGTEVEIIIPSAATRNAAHAGPVRLPVFNGGGLQPGVNLDDSRATRRLSDESGKLSQLP